MIGPKERKPFCLWSATGSSFVRGDRIAGLLMALLKSFLILNRLSWELQVQIVDQIVDFLG